MELSSGKLAKFADGSAVVQVKTKNSLNLCSFKILYLKSHCLGIRACYMWDMEPQVAISSLMKGQLYFIGKIMA